MPDFSYSPDQLNKLSNLLSAERLGVYLRAAKGDLRTAISLYEKNIRLSEALYGVLQGLELAVRNSMHNALTVGLGNNWYLDSVFSAPETEKIQEARKKILDNGKSITPGQMVANLSFGFWVALASKKYARGLWDQHLYKAFPHKKMNHLTAHARLKELRDLRNRVAHHEPIWNRNLKADLTAVLETVGWISPETAAWLQVTNRLAILL